MFNDFSLYFYAYPFSKQLCRILRVIIIIWELFYYVNMSGVYRVNRLGEKGVTSTIVGRSEIM